MFISKKKSFLTQFNFTFFSYPTRQSLMQYSWTRVIFYWISLSYLPRVNAFYYFESHYWNLNVFSTILPNNSESIYLVKVCLQILRFFLQIVFTKHFLLFYWNELFIIGILRDIFSFTKWLLTTVNRSMIQFIYLPLSPCQPLMMKR